MMAAIMGKAAPANPEATEPAVTVAPADAPVTLMHAPIVLANEPVLSVHANDDDSRAITLSPEFYTGAAGREEPLPTVLDPQQCSNCESTTARSECTGCGKAFCNNCIGCQWCWIVCEDCRVDNFDHPYFATSMNAFEYLSQFSEEQWDLMPRGISISHFNGPKGGPFLSKEFFYPSI
jgi:ferredoxin